MSASHSGRLAFLPLAPWIAEPADFAKRAADWLKTLPRDQYPNTVELADTLVGGSGDDQFEWGLDVIVRGLATYLTSPPSPEARWPRSSGP